MIERILHHLGYVKKIKLEQALTDLNNIAYDLKVQRQRSGHVFNQLREVLWRLSLGKLSSDQTIANGIIRGLLDRQKGIEEAEIDTIRTRVYFQYEDMILPEFVDATVKEEMN